MSRPRLRFLLQEIDLRDGETLVGRSVHCHVTIEDPLVSRQHARLLVTRSGTTIEDLDSRNGTLVNGRAIRAAVELRDGDRIRIGTLELVYSRAS
ncbi:MAG TPA: FHA domain-containing protein, partial [Polyangiaceae bacterium]|nr:FHA domain-containing protein [Polyangiaceae bacterium]